MSHIIFRKSENTNSFGLRGYWTYNPETFELHSFATSRELVKWSTITDLQAAGFELLRKEGQILPTKRAAFITLTNQQKAEDNIGHAAVLACFDKAIEDALA
jgi:hypothetical protein